MSLNTHCAPSCRHASFPISFCMLFTLNIPWYGSQKSSRSRIYSMYLSVMPTAILVVSIMRPRMICFGPTVSTFRFSSNIKHWQTSMLHWPQTKKIASIIAASSLSMILSWAAATTKLLLMEKTVIIFWIIHQRASHELAKVLDPKTWLVEMK
jgi:hypothetical protein